MTMRSSLMLEDFKQHTATTAAAEDLFAAKASDEMPLSSIVPLVLHLRLVNASSSSNATPERAVFGVNNNNCDDLLKEAVLVLLGGLGIVGNIFALLVMRRTSKRLPARSAYPYSLSVLAIMDTLVLFFDAVNAGNRIGLITLQVDWFMNKVDIGSFGCALYRFVVPLCRFMSHWVVVAITAERFIAICLPFKIKMSARKSKLIIVGVGLTAVLSQIWRLFYDRKTLYAFGGASQNVTSDTTKNNADDANHTRMLAFWDCGPPQHLMLIYVTVDQFYHRLVLLFLLPAFSILSMNAAVVVKLYRTHLAMKEMGVGYHVGRTTPVLRQRSAAPAASQSCCIRSDSLSSASTDVTTSFCCSTTSSGRSSAHSNRLRSSANKRGSPALGRSLSITSSDQPSTLARGAKSGTTASLLYDERSFLRTSLLLLAVTCSFLLCLVPELALLMYVLVIHLIEGPLVAARVFARLCQVIKAAEIITTLGYADNFIIFAFACGKFRGELVLMVFKCFGRCFTRCDDCYWRTKSESRCRNYIGATGSTSITPRNAGRNNKKTSSSATRHCFTHRLNAAQDDDGAEVSRLESGVLDMARTPPPPMGRLKPIAEDMKTIL